MTTHNHWKNIVQSETCLGFGLAKQALKECDEAIVASVSHDGNNYRPNTAVGHTLRLAIINVL